MFLFFIVFIFLVLVSNPFFWIGYTFFWFWVLVKCKKWFIFCIWFCFFIYILFYFGYSPGIPLYLVSPFLFGPLFIRSSPFIQSIKTKLIFICHPFAPTAAPALTASSRPRQSSSVDCSYLQKCVRIKKLCKTHYKCH